MCSAIFSSLQKLSHSSSAPLSEAVGDSEFEFLIDRLEVKIPAKKAGGPNKKRPAEAGL
jgi:hypothetical protein